VSVTAEIGIRWLMPRFHRFRAQHPNIDIAILSTYQLADLSAGEADLALRYGEGKWPGLQAEPFLRFAVSPLCAPSLMDSLGGLSLHEALASSTLIRTYGDDWDSWIESAGASNIKPAGQLRLAEYSMGVTAAINGQGLALGYSGYVETEIASGVLVQPFKLTVPVKNAYYLVYLDQRLADPRVRAFREWVISESEAAHNNDRTCRALEIQRT
jgi:LysR family glycine cleavage system transcriptional activator